MAGHGVLSTYTTHGCRCDECRAAMAAYQRQHRAALAGLSIPPYVAHGTVNAYANYGCRCLSCNAENATRQRRQRQKAAASP
jgi:hypothetical protein